MKKLLVDLFFSWSYLLFPSLTVIMKMGCSLKFSGKWPSPHVSMKRRKMMRELCIWLVFWLQDGNEVFFRIKRSTQLKKLMNAYCDRQSVDFNSIAFLFDGRRLRAEQTPDELEMEDGDEIDAMLHQTGGTTLWVSFSFVSMDVRLYVFQDGIGLSEMLVGSFRTFRV